MPESGTSGSAGGALGRLMVTSTRARRRKRRTQTRESLPVAHQRPLPTADLGADPTPIHSRRTVRRCPVLTVERQTGLAITPVNVAVRKELRMVALAMVEILP